MSYLLNVSAQQKIMPCNGIPPSIVLTNSGLPSPWWVTKAALIHPRCTCTRRNFSRQIACQGDGDIEGSYTNDGMYSNKWQLLSTVFACAGRMRCFSVFFSKCQNKLHRIIVLVEPAVVTSSFKNTISWCHRHCLLIFLVALCTEALC